MSPHAEGSAPDDPSEHADEGTHETSRVWDQPVTQTLCWRYMADLHNKIPRAKFLGWLDNLKSFLQCTTESASDALLIGSGCSGTDIAAKLLEVASQFWGREYACRVGQVKCMLACELDTNKQVFLKHHHPNLDCLFADVKELEGPYGFDILQGARRCVPHVPGVFTAGFSCKDICMQNNTRSKNKGCVRHAMGTTGQTFHFIANYVVQHRPRLTFLENVPSLKNGYEEGGVVTSDLEYIQEFFESRGMTIVSATMYARDYGSYAQRVRLWMVIWDIPPAQSKAVGMEGMCLELLHAQNRALPCCGLLGA